MTLREHTGRTVEFKLVDRNTNIDFAEDWLNAGALQRDTEGCNPDVEGKLNANLFCF